MSNFFSLLLNSLELIIKTDAHHSDAAAFIATKINAISFITQD